MKYRGKTHFFCHFESQKMSEKRQDLCLSPSLSLSLSLSLSHTHTHKHKNTEKCPQTQWYSNTPDSHVYHAVHLTRVTIPVLVQYRTRSYRCWCMSSLSFSLSLIHPHSHTPTHTHTHTGLGLQRALVFSNKWCSIASAGQEERWGQTERGKRRKESMYYQRCQTYPDKMCDNWLDSTACAIRYEAHALILRMCVLEHMD